MSIPPGRRATVSKRVFTAIVCGQTIGWGSLTFVALTIGVLKDGYGFTLTQSGVLATVELSTMAAAVALVGPVLRILSLRHLAVLGGLLAAAGNLLSASFSDVWIVGLLRIVTGAGTGFTVGAINTAISRTNDAEQLFVDSNIAIIALSVGFFVGMPMIYVRLGYPAYFVAYGLMCLAATASLGWLADETPVADERSIRGSRWGRRGTGLLFAVCLFWFCYSVLWSMSERLGRDIGLSDVVIGRVLGLGTFAGFAGSVVAAWLTRRMLQPLPILICAFGTGLCCVALTFTHSAVVYTAAMCAFGVAFCPFSPYALGIATEVDRSGGLGRAIMSGFAAMSALAPVLATRLVVQVGNRGLGLATFAGVIGACVLLGMLTPRRKIAPDAR